MLSLCSGIGGADLAASWAGIDIVGQVEIDPFCQAVLAKHWPSVRRMEDIKDVQGNEFGEIDIIVAGFPCQPHSLAGKRQGSQDERNLWPEVRRIIGTVKPGWFVGENVCGLLTVESGGFFGSILADLVTLGYSGVGWGVYGACEVGAPHRRERVFIVAHAQISECQCASTAWRVRAGSANSSSPLADPSGSRWEECDTATIAREQGHIAWRSPSPGNVEDTTGGREWQHQTTGTQEGTQSLHIQSSARSTQPGVCRVSDGFSSRLDRSQRWPAGPGEQQHSWEPPRTITERIPDRAKRLKALGNAIVPQQIYPIFEAIVKMEEEEDGRR